MAQDLPTHELVQFLGKSMGTGLRWVDPGVGTSAMVDTSVLPITG